MLYVIMSGEEQFSGDQLADYAADRPHIADFVPSYAFEDHFRRSVLPGVYCGAVVLVLPGRPSEVDDPYFLAAWQVVLFPTIRVPWIGLIVQRRLQQNILGFQVSVSVADRMQKPD